MRKIIVFNLISLDSFFAGKNDDISWHRVDEEFDKFSIEQTKNFGGIIFGRKTYELFESYWPKVLIDPKTSEDDRKIAQIIDDVEKIVFSKSLKKAAWKNSIFLSEINPQTVKKLKEKKGKDLVIFGSGEIVQQLSNLNLIDEYRMLINPLLLGEGKAMFKNVKLKNLKLINTRVFKNGNVLLTYKSA